MRLRYFALALTLLAAFASDSWGQSKQPPNQSKQSAQPTAAPDQRGTEQSPAFIKIVPSQKTAEETEADRKERERKDSSDRALVWLTGALAVVGFMQLLVFGWQGIQLKRAVSATQAAIELSNKEFIATHRPKIVVWSLEFGGDANGGEPIPISFRYVNSGDSPALVTGFGSRVMRLSETAVTAGLEFSHQNIDPPIEVESGMHGFRLTPDTISPDEIVASGIMDTDKIVCVGYVLYRDRNGTRRQVGFCRAFNSETGRWTVLSDDEYEYSY